MQRTEPAAPVALRGDRRRRLPPLQRAIITLVHLREHTTYAKLAAGSRIGEGTVSGFRRHCRPHGQYHRRPRLRRL
ncbi:transposase family protein [Streptomyces rhizosphaericola]|uniref:transposase family protein n=2 Tax=Streptomyces rhizosphaericola TaxID=2564098 RepID=UPI0039EE860B